MICPFLLWPRFSRRRLTLVGAVELRKGSIKICEACLGFRTKDNVFFELEGVILWVCVGLAGVKAVLGVRGWDGVLGGNGEGLSRVVFRVELRIRELADCGEEYEKEK